MLMRYRIDYQYWLKLDLFICIHRYTGFYKGIQSAGAAVAWQVDSHTVPFMNQLIANWALTTISFPLLVALVVLAVKDDNKDEEGATKEASITSNRDISTTVDYPNKE